MLISCVINVDTRPSKNEQGGLFNGVANPDFLTDNIFNKINFFKGFDFEAIVFIDEHIPVPEKTLEYLRSICDVVCIRKHTSEPSFNDWNYHAALGLCRGDIIAHFDQDVSAFTSGPEAVQELIDMLEDNKYISYPSQWSPTAVHDPTFNYRWVSTRFFMCKRETLDFTEMRKCLTDYDYFVAKYSPSRICPWTEHHLGLIAESKVFYPPINHDKLSIFTWGRYEDWLLRRLNEFSYDQVKDWLNSHPIVYPNDIYA